MKLEIPIKIEKADLRKIINEIVYDKIQTMKKETCAGPYDQGYNDALTDLQNRIER